MEKDFKSFNLVGKYSGNDGNAAGERGTVSKYVITGSDGKGLVVEITDPQDNLSVKALIPRVKSGDDDAIRQIAPIIHKYNSLASAMLLFKTGDYGDGWLALGEYYDKQSMEKDAFKGYKKAAQYGHPCGMCKLGRYYAEGKGCKKDRKKAKQMLKEAAQVCPDAEKYLDQYGLR